MTRNTRIVIRIELDWVRRLRIRVQHSRLFELKRLSWKDRLFLVVIIIVVIIITYFGTNAKSKLRFCC